LEIKCVHPNVDWDQDLMDLKIKKTKRDKARSEKKTKAKN
jgi:hypothetical protein